MLENDFTVALVQYRLSLEIVASECHSEVEALVCGHLKVRVEVILVSRLENVEPLSCQKRIDLLIGEC